MSVLPPTVNREAVAFEDRALLRQQWGADETTFVVALVGESTGWASGRVAMEAAGRAALTGRAITIVMPPEAVEPGGLRTWFDRLGVRKLVVVDKHAAQPWRIMPGLDAAILATRGKLGGRPAELPARGTAWLANTPFSGWLIGTSVASRSHAAGYRSAPGLLGVLWAMACGVPVIAEENPVLRDIVDPCRTGLLFSPGDRDAAAEGILELYDRPQLGRDMAAAAIELVRQRFDPGAFLSRLAEVHRQCGAGETVRVRNVATAGTRTTTEPVAT